MSKNRREKGRIALLWSIKRRRRPLLRAGSAANAVRACLAQAHHCATAGSPVSLSVGM